MTWSALTPLRGAGNLHGARAGVCGVSGHCGVGERALLSSCVVRRGGHVECCRMSVARATVTCLLVFDLCAVTGVVLVSSSRDFYDFFVFRVSVLLLQDVSRLESDPPTDPHPGPGARSQLRRRREPRRGAAQPQGRQTSAGDPHTAGPARPPAAVRRRRPHPTRSSTAFPFIRLVRRLGPCLLATTSRPSASPPPGSLSSSASSSSSSASSPSATPTG